MQVANCDGQGVGGIARLWRFGESQQVGHHVLYLNLLGLSVSHDGGFD
jgi:hypothetical protein